LSSITLSSSNICYIWYIQYNLKTWFIWYTWYILYNWNIRHSVRSKHLIECINLIYLIYLIPSIHLIHLQPYNLFMFKTRCFSNYFSFLLHQRAKPNIPNVSSAVVAPTVNSWLSKPPTMKLNVWKFAWQMPSVNGFHIWGNFCDSFELDIVFTMKEYLESGDFADRRKKIIIGRET